MLTMLNHYDGEGYKLHACVVMPDHLHLLITPFGSIEKSVQLSKGGFSFRAKREREWKGEIWQQGLLTIESGMKRNGLGIWTTSA